MQWQLSKSAAWVSTCVEILGIVTPSAGGVESVTGYGVNNDDPVNPILANNMDATTDPTVTDDSDSGYVVGSEWFNKSTGTLFVAEDVTVGAAVWNQVSGGTGTPLTVKQNGTTIETNVNTINITGAANVTTPSAGQVDIDILGGSGSGGTKLAIDTTDVTINGTTAKTEAYRITVPGGTLGDNNAITAEWFINEVAASGGSNGVHFSVEYGGSELATFELDTVTSGLVQNGIIRLTLVADNSVAAQKSKFEYWEGEASGTPPSPDKIIIYNAVTVDSTVNQDLVFYVRPDSAGHTIQTKAVIVEKITDAGSTDVQVFTADDTWVKPAGAKVVQIIAVGAGGGGAGGVGGGPGPGAGGGGGQAIDLTFDASIISSTVAVTVGVGGNGGSPNNDGVDGTLSSFGTYVIAKPGLKGLKGGGAGGSGGGIALINGNAISGQGTQGVAGPGRNAEYGGGAGSGGINNIPTDDAGSSMYGGGGGGHGGYGAGNGREGGAVGQYSLGGGGAGGSGGLVGPAGNGGNGLDNTAIGTGYGGQGGGGGGSTQGGGFDDYGDGGNGGFPGGGGGGGGAITAGVATSGGAGGNGGNGQVTVITYF